MKNRKGVTLVELLIVVMILGALAAIALPRITKSAGNAREQACKTNLSLINSAIEMYYVDEGGYPATLNLVTGNLDYFPDGPPTCPLGGSYSLSTTGNYRAVCDH